MRFKLLNVAIVAGLGFSTMAAHAQSASSQSGRASTASASTQAELEALKAQLAALQSKMAELEARTDAQSEINVSTGQGVEKATTVSASTDKRLEKLEKLVDNTSLSGRMYFDYTNIDQKNSDTGKTNASGTGIDVKRFYLGVDHKFNDIWSMNITTDFNYVSNDGETNLFVKKAYVQGKFSDAFVFRAGASDMPWIPYVEKYYGYRYVENTLTDRLKYGDSSDWGLHVGGDLGASKSVSYDVAVVNGNGYKNPSRSKSPSVEARVGFLPVENLVVAVGGYSGKRGQDLENNNTAHTATRGDIMVAYASDLFRLGAEYFTAKDWNNVLTVAGDKATGYSLWGSYALNSDWAVFARYDKSKLSKDIDPSSKDTYYNAGVEYQVTKGFKLAGVYKHTKDERSVNAPVPPHVQNVKTDEIGVWGEVRF